MKQPLKRGISWSQKRTSTLKLDDQSSVKEKVVLAVICVIILLMFQSVIIYYYIKVRIYTFKYTIIIITGVCYSE